MLTILVAIFAFTANQTNSETTTLPQTNTANTQLVNADSSATLAPHTAHITSTWGTATTAINTIAVAHRIN